MKEMTAEDFEDMNDAVDTINSQGVLIDVWRDECNAKDKLIAQLVEALEKGLNNKGHKWWCPSCMCEISPIEVSYDEHCCRCGQSLSDSNSYFVNSPEWEKEARAALAKAKGQDE